MKTYISKYASPLLRGTDNPETPRPWDIQSILEQYSTTRRRLLDVGCGTCFKLIPLNTYFDEIVGLDISENMLRAAEKNIESHGIKNIHLLMADSYKMPLQDNQFDLMTGLLSRWNIQELQRVLSKDGLIILEQLGAEDKKDLKLFFGKDKQGPRGQFLEFTRESCIEHFHKGFSEYFEDVQIIDGFWETYYTEEGIHELLKYTPTVRDFSKNDIPKMNEAIQSLKSGEYIKLKQHRMLIYAQCPKKYSF